MATKQLQIVVALYISVVHGLPAAALIRMFRWFVHQPSTRHRK